MTTSTQSLASWLLERIAEDEQRARRVDAAYADEAKFWANAEVVNAGALVNPARVLAECEAKRRIVELHDHDEGSCWEMHRGVYGPGWPEGSGRIEGRPWAHPSLEGPDVHPGPCETLQLLAVPYADRPGYREEWKP